MPAIPASVAEYQTAVQHDGGADIHLEVVMLGCHLVQLVSQDDVILSLVGKYEGDLGFVLRVVHNL